MAEDAPGMKKSEWHDLEGDALRAEGEATGNKPMILHGINRHIEAADNRHTEELTENFKELFPGEEPPTDLTELRSRVQIGLDASPKDKKE